MTWISLRAARAQLGKDPYAVRALADAGCFATRRVDGRDQFALEPEQDRRLLIDTFYERHAPCLDEAAFLCVKRVVNLLAGLPKLDPPRGFMDDAMRFMHGNAMSLEIGTLMLLTGATEKTARQHIVHWCARNCETSPDFSRYFSAPAGDHEALVLARLPTHLRNPPGTYLAKGGHPDDKPSELMFARLNSIRNQTLFEAITLDTLRLTATLSHQVVNRAIRSFAAFDDQLGAADACDPYAIRTVLEALLGHDWMSRKGSELGISETVVRYLHVFERLAEYMRTSVPGALRSKFARHQLTLPAGHEKFFRKVKQAVHKYQKACAANRQDRIESILDNPLEFLLVGRLRLLEHTIIRDACRKKIDEIIKKGEPLTEPVRFQHPYSTRLINDRFRRCKQIIHLAVWPWDLVHARLRATPEKSQGREAMYAMNQVEDISARSGYVIAYLGVSPQTPGDPTQEPLIAEVAKSFVLCSSGNLTPGQRAMQADALKRWQYSEKSALPAGLPWFEKIRRHAALDSNTLLTDVGADGIARPVVLIPHDEFCHGLMIAHSSVFIAADAGCRTGETLLAPSQSAAFEPVTDPKSGEVFKRFDSIGKNGKPVHPMMSPDTFKHFTDMIIEGAQRWHGGKLAPPVPPNAHFQMRDIKTVARYAYTLEERMLNYSELASLARVLYFGWFGLEGHDVRHVFNAMGRRAGIPPEVRQRLLNHADPSTEALYGPATPTEVSMRQIQLNKQTSDRMAKLLEDSTDGMSPEMAIALRELRRAEMNVRFYEQEGWSEEAKAVREEVKDWAERFARAMADHTRASEVIHVAAI